MKNINPLKRAFQATAHSIQTHPLPLRTTCYLQTEKPADEVLLERCILNPEHSETCHSGTDDEVGRHKSPYDPTKTTPELEHLALEEEYRLEGDTVHDPLFYSPANRDFSLIVDPEAGVVHTLKHLRSVRGWTNKRKEVLLRTAPYEMRKYDSVFTKLRKPGEKTNDEPLAQPNENSILILKSHANPLLLSASKVFEDANLKYIASANCQALVEHRTRQQVQAMTAIQRARYKRVASVVGPSNVFFMAVTNQHKAKYFETDWSAVIKQGVPLSERPHALGRPSYINYIEYSGGYPARNVVTIIGKDAAGDWHLLLKHGLRRGQ